MLLKPVDGEMATTSVYAAYRALLGCKAHKYWLLCFGVFGVFGVFGGCCKSAVEVLRNAGFIAVS